MLHPASTPDATAQVFSNRVCIQGSRHDVVGKGEDTISMQPVALVTITSLPSALTTNRTASASAHPTQARCPGEKFSSFVMSFGT